MQHPLINIAIKAVRSASKIILHAIDRLDMIHVEEKSDNDFVTVINQQAEQEIIRIIHESYPTHAIFGENKSTNNYTWIVNPIDGMTNFIHGNPHFCISIGIQYKNRIEHGVIYDPLRHELFIATNGSGAFLNERRIRIAQQKQFPKAIVSSNLGNKDIKNTTNYLQILTSIIPRIACIRYGGSVALDFAYVACGRLDGMFGLNLTPWDMAAGILIIQEAGGTITDFNNNHSYLTTGEIIAGNISATKSILQIIQNRF
ncbi:MAG: inositol monophosphatase [Coxiellaceae bacterium]|jgi:myo-inositol-1(or 4)-monophosphatase|nr:inositol monophosphatase [Coxiellaceae bacterium]